MLDLLDLSIGKSKREPTADEKLAALSRDTRRRRKILQDAWAESQRIDTVKHAKIHGLVGYEMLRRKDEQKRDARTESAADVTRDGSVDARELIEPMAILGVARDRASVERLANAINEKDADGEPGLNMDEFRDFAITNGLRPAELRKTAAKGSSDLLAVETQISVARRRQRLDALMGPGSPTSPEKRKQLDQLRVTRTARTGPRASTAPVGRSTRPRRVERLDAELSRRKRPRRCPRGIGGIRGQEADAGPLGAFDRTAALIWLPSPGTKAAARETG